MNNEDMLANGKQPSIPTTLKKPAGDRAPWDPATGAARLLTVRKVRACGFSLVEVVLALGVLAVALPTMLGVMAMSNSSLRNAGSRQISSEVFQSLAGDIRNAAVTGGHQAVLGLAATRYFDVRGLPSSQDDAVIEVRISPSPAPTVVGGVTLDGLRSADIWIQSLSDPQTRQFFAVSYMDRP